MVQHSSVVWELSGPWIDNFRMNTGMVARYGATYNMVALITNFRVFELNFRCCQRIQQRQSYKLRVHGMNPQSPLKV
jgi:hypothetical protein